MVANYNVVRGFEGSVEFPTNLTDGDNLLYFTHSSFAVENALWRTDGTRENTLTLVESGQDEALNSINLKFSTGTNGKMASSFLVLLTKQMV